MFANYYDLDMNLIDTGDMITTFLHIPSVPFENRWESGEGITPTFIGAEAKQKTIEATIELLSYDYLDYNLLRDKLYGVFGFNQPFYVVDKRQKGKRHKVILESNFMPERKSTNNGTAVIPFVTCETPYAESLGRTTDIDANGINSDDELWGFGMGLIDDDELIYTHEGTAFKIFNAGNEAIHPFEQDLKIIINNIQGSSSYFELKNITNGTRFRTTTAVASGHEIVIDGPIVTRNALSFLRNTTKEFITLEPGWNEFEISGATNAKTIFDFRFYYK